MPARHPLAGFARTSGITLEELADQPFILATGGCLVNGQSLMENAGLKWTDVRVKVRDWVSACLLAGEGLGVALVPESALPETLRGLCVVPLPLPCIVSLDWFVRHREMHLLRRRRYSTVWVNEVVEQRISVSCVGDVGV
jgi:DNA-binding transcriptional LysR family regulator